MLPAPEAGDFMELIVLYTTLLFHTVRPFTKHRQGDLQHQSYVFLAFHH
jgi:hypothetical protein